MKQYISSFTVGMTLLGLTLALQLTTEVETSTAVEAQAEVEVVAKAKNPNAGPPSLRDGLECEQNNSCEVTSEEYCETIRVDVTTEDDSLTTEGTKVEEEWCRLDTKWCDLENDVCKISRCELDDSLCWFQQCTSNGYCTSAWSTTKCNEETCETKLCAGDSWCRYETCPVEETGGCTVDTVVCDLDANCSRESCDADGNCETNPTDEVLVPFNPKYL